MWSLSRAASCAGRPHAVGGVGGVVLNDLSPRHACLALIRFTDLDRALAGKRGVSRATGLQGASSLSLTSASLGRGSKGSCCGGCIFGSLLVLRLLLDGPIEDVVVLERFADKEVSEKLSEVRVVGLVVKAQGAAVVEVDGKLVGEAAAEDLGGGGHLLFHDPVVLLFLGGGFEALPGQLAAQKVHEDVAEGFHVVSAGLLDSEMGVDGGVPSCAGEILVLAVGDVEMGLGVAVFFGEPKVDDIDLVTPLADAHEEVVWLDVAVNEVARVDVLYARDLLGKLGSE